MKVFVFSVNGSIGVYGLAFMVEVVVRYNPIMHKTQPQKLKFLVFCSLIFSGSHTQTSSSTSKTNILLI